MKTKHPTLFMSILLILAFFSGAFGSFGVQYFVLNQTDFRYPLLAKRVQIENPNDIQLNYTKLRSKLTTYIQSQGENSDNISLFFEYLPTGVSININESNESIAASLMKLPVVMNLYKSAELGRVDLDKQVALKQEWLNDEYGTLYQKGPGYELTIREAARLTLKDSDNTALLLIWDQIAEANLEPENDSLNYLDIEYGIVEDDRVKIGARSYSSILKCIYLSCFNDQTDSQEMLEFLTQSSFNDRLTRYLPENLKVAHKIGTYNTRFQSDCGVVYIDTKNYLLCIMVSGDDPLASEIIADLSQEVYLFVSEDE